MEIEVHAGPEQRLDLAAGLFADLLEQLPSPAENTGKSRWANVSNTGAMVKKFASKMGSP